MSRRVRVEPEAEAELQAAAEWYESQQAGLGFALLEASELTYQELAEGDHGTPVPGVKTPARRLPIVRFPLWVVFVELADEVVVVAYSHEKRRPGYWLGRLRES